jgi:alkylation response protein AidB-like acyl-CoA dehydrogenase
VSSGPGDLGTIGLDDDHRALHASARRWVEAHGPLTVARATLDAAPGALPACWPALVDQGWLGLAVAEDLGGDGYTLAEVAVVLEELGRTVVPGPFVPTLLAALVVDRLAPATIRARLGADLASGHRTGAVAFATPGLQVVDRPAGAVVEGAVTPVLGGATADVFVLPVEGSGAPAWVVLTRDQVEVTPLPSLDPTRPLATVTVGGVGAEADCWIRPPGEVGVLELAAVVLGAELVGSMAWCVGAAAAYAADRVQFGRPIGQFQAVKHRCADMLAALELARAAAWDGARGLDAGGDEGALAAAVVGALVPDAAFTVAKDCIQVHGGIGFTWEHDAHLFLRRATTVRQLLGGTAHWRARVAELTRAGARRALSFDLPADAERYRPAVRSFVDELRAAPRADWNRRIAEAGYLVPHWPEPWGLGADALHQLVIDEELAAAEVRRAHLAVGMWVLPTLIAHGTAAQQERFIGPTMRLELTWCQLFSEPGAGSDLASLTTRAERSDDDAGPGWRLTGQKVWTTLAQAADWGICLARTDPQRPKHDGITCFLVDMRSPGVEIRPLRELTGQELFNEVYLDDVFVPDECVVGEVNGGWGAARTTLANERVSMGSGSSFGPGTEAVLELVARQHQLGADPRVLDEVGGLVARGQAIAVMGTRMTLLALSGHDAGAEASVKKLLGVEHEQHVQEVGLGLLGAMAPVLEGDGRTWVDGFLGNRALSIAGGTSEVQRNVIAERLLGLPKDP